MPRPRLRRRQEPGHGRIIKADTVRRPWDAHERGPPRARPGRPRPERRQVAPHRRPLRPTPVPAVAHAPAEASAPHLVPPVDEPRVAPAAEDPGPPASMPDATPAPVRDCRARRAAGRVARRRTTERRTPERGAAQRRTPGSAAPLDGVPHNDAPHNGAPHNGAPQHGPAQHGHPQHGAGPAQPGPRPINGQDRGSPCTAPQLRRFIKSRPYVPMHELRRRFAIDGDDDDVSPIALQPGLVFVGLPAREGQLLGELLRAGEVGYELSLDPRTPIVIGVYPMRPVPRP